MKVLTSNDPIVGTTEVVGSHNHLVVVSCGGYAHKEAFIVADGRANNPPIFNLYVEADKHPAFANVPESLFPKNLDPSCIDMTDPYRSGLPWVYTDALSWTRVCYLADAAEFVNDFETRYLATALQAAIPRGDAESTMAFARDNFIGESNRTIQLDFSSLKINFHDVVLFNCIVSCFICYILYIRSKRLNLYDTQSVAPSIFLDHDSVTARFFSVIALAFLCVAPIFCIFSVVIFDKIGLIIPGPKVLADFTDRTICKALGTSCGSNLIGSVSVTMTVAAWVGILSEIVMLLAVANFGRYIVRARRFPRKSRRIAVVRSRFL